MTSEVAQLLEFLRFPSISTDTRFAGDVRACGEWLVEKSREIGLSAELHETPRHPVVIARNEHRPGRKHVLIYGHYDVQPVDPLNLWTSDPFQPEIRDGRIWARGATDNKGQMFAHLMGVAQTMATHGDLPVNLTFLFEGEEEIGSPHLAAFLENHREWLACDVIAVSDTGMVAPGVPTMGYGLRGITCGELVVRGPARDLHSGLFGGAVMNPATALGRLIASLHDAEGKVLIDGFYDDVRPLEAWEREMWAQVPGVGEADFLQVTGAPALFGEAGYSPAEQTWARPTAEVNGMGGGYQGEGSKTVLPAEAMAKFSFRLVPDQDPADIIEKVRRHFEKHCPPGVTIEFVPGHDGKAYHADPHGVFGKAAQRALQKAFGKEPVLIREGGSIPIIQSFREILGADTLLLGLALADAQIHSPNENFPVENFEAGIRLNQALLEELAAS
ncbi:acetylornithine deacetylase/succinyl-diaminopimelate desuccinylase-like protein [Haloferula luteola]|uniref:Acetylornithine deacetylase/succinyl-diaminopimelate desuccinylase-like protein n=2 Tax=Haloferula luteola TaxID=595692 RepID=A0A840UY01_9BACT|nr:acetylornithine deacetylase/succinyl-diaminopimelate desuccinylase-like protein [Haloferula luteola]